MDTPQDEAWNGRMQNELTQRRMQVESLRTQNTYLQTIGTQQVERIRELEQERDEWRFKASRIAIADERASIHPSWEHADKATILKEFAFQGGMTKVLIDETDALRQQFAAMTHERDEQGEMKAKLYQVNQELERRLTSSEQQLAAAQREIAGLTDELENYRSMAEREGATVAVSELALAQREIKRLREALGYYAKTAISARAVQALTSGKEATMPVPYPEFCGQHEVCRGLVSCPRDPNCCD